MKGTKVLKSKKTSMKGNDNKDVIFTLLKWIVTFVILAIGLVKGTELIVKVTPELATQLVLKDNKAYVEQYGNPNNWEARDKAHNELVAFNNALINSDDGTISFFFKQKAITKLFLLLAAGIPHLIIIKKIIKFSKHTKKQIHIMRKTQNSVKAVR